MAEAALAALYRAVYNRLVASGDVWGSRAYPDLAPAKILVSGLLTPTPRPYTIFSWAGGGEINQLIKQDAEIVLTIKGVSETLTEAFAIAGRISALFDDQDAGDPTALSGAPDWQIIHVNQEQIVHLVEGVDATWIYHAGHRFRFLMETN